MIELNDIQGNQLLSVSITQSCQKVDELMAADYIQLSWNSDLSNELPLGAYIEYNGEKYSLLEPYKPTQKDESEYTYTPKFESRVRAWGKKPFFFYSGASKEPDWTLTSNPADFMRCVCDAIREETGESWTYSIDASLQASASLSFSSSDILSGLNQIAGAFETEWFADKSTNTLYLGLLSHGDEVTLEVGKNISVPSVQSSKEGYYTRFYAFGSTRNITQEYNGSNTNNLVNKRLTLDPNKYPEGYKDIRSGLKEGEIFSKVLIFDDVYPSAKLSISGVRNRLMYRLDESGNKIQLGTDDSGNPIYDQYTIWYFRIEGFAFDWENVIDGLTPSISFQSGALNGREFEVIYYNEAKKITTSDGIVFEANKGDYEIKFIEENNFIIPSMTGLVPSDGDEVILYNIKMPREYTQSAYTELEKELDKAIARMTSDLSNYSFKSNPVAFNENNPNLSIGRKVRYINGSYSYSTRVIKLTTQLDFPIEQSITIGNEKVKGNTQQLKEEVASANKDLNLLAVFNDMTQTIQQSYNRTQQMMLDGFAAIKNIWQLRETESGEKYIFSAFDVATQKGVTMYADGGMLDLPSIYDGLPLDNDTIYWEEIKDEEGNVIGKRIKARGGSGGGSADFSNVLYSGNGNAFTSFVLSDDKKTLTFVKGLTFAEKSNTLSGYGITDAYTKTEVDGLVGKYLSLQGGTIQGDVRLRAGSEYTSPYLYFGDSDEVFLVEETDQSLTIHADKNILLDVGGNVTLNGDAVSTEKWVKTQLGGYAEKATTLVGYGITDAKISNGVITLGSNTITPITSHQTIYNLTLQAGAFSAAIFDPNGAAKTVNIPTTTSHISEDSNLYFTNERAVAALDDTLSLYVTKAGTQTITGEKDFTGGLKVNGSPIVYDKTNKYWKFEGNLLVTGGITMYGVDGSSFGAIWDNAPLATSNKDYKGVASFDPNYFSVSNGYVTFIGQTGGGGIESITKQMVIDALGYTPYNSTNPNGYITSSGSITGNAATSTKVYVTSVANTGPFPIIYTDVSSVGSNGYRSLYCTSKSGTGYNPVNDTFVASYFNGDVNGNINIGGDTSYRIETFTNGLELNTYSLFRIMQSGTTRLYMDSNGNFGIKTSSPASALHVAGSATIDSKIFVDDEVTIQGGTSNPYVQLVHGSKNWYLQCYNSSYMYIGAGTANSFRIDANGNCLIPASTAYGLTIKRTLSNGGAYTKYQPCNQENQSWASGVNNSYQYSWWYQNVSSGIDVQKMYLDSSGNLLTTGGITMYGSSDARLKINIRTFKASEELMNLGGVFKFEYTDDEIGRNEIYKGTHIGLIYQNVKKTSLAKMCYEREDGYGALNYLDSSFISLLAGVGMEHETRLQRLERENRELRMEVEQLKNK